MRTPSSQACRRSLSRSLEKCTASAPTWFSSNTMSLDVTSRDSPSHFTLIEPLTADHISSSSSSSHTYLNLAHLL